MTMSARMQMGLVMLSAIFVTPFVFTGGLLAGSLVYALATGEQRGHGYSLAGYAGAAVSCIMMACLFVAWWLRPSIKTQSAVIAMSLAVAQPFLTSAWEGWP